MFDQSHARDYDAIHVPSVNRGPRLYLDIVARDRHAIHFRCAEPPTPNPDKYADELLDGDDADALYAEYARQGVEPTLAHGDTPWHSREFVVKDCEGLGWPSVPTCRCQSP